jgi:hypothetical protein
MNIFRRFRDAVRRKGPPKTDKQQLVSPSRKCSITPVGFGQGFIIKEQCDIIGATSMLF